MNPILQQQFSRTIDLLTEEGFRRLSESFIIVVGLGGVGSHAALALARAGVSHLRLIDFDRITISSLNRHPLALHQDIGKSKAQVTKDYLHQIGEHLKIEAKEEFFHKETKNGLLSGNPDYIVDAIDSLGPKVELLKSCVDGQIKVVSSMGAAGRTDPTKLRVGPLEKTRGCPLAKLVRKRLRRQGVVSGITTVYSTEVAYPTLPPDESEPWYDRGRKRNRLASLMTLIGIFGYAVANIVIMDLSGFSHQGS